MLALEPQGKIRVLLALLFRHGKWGWWVSTWSQLVPGTPCDTRYQGRQASGRLHLESGVLSRHSEQWAVCAWLSRGFCSVGATFLKTTVPRDYCSQWLSPHRPFPWCFADLWRCRGLEFHNPALPWLPGSPTRVFPLCSALSFWWLRGRDSFPLCPLRACSSRHLSLFFMLWRFDLRCWRQLTFL